MTISGAAIHSIPSSPKSRPPSLGLRRDADSVAPSAPISQRVSLAPRRRLPVAVDFAARTDKGRKRVDNQDSLLVDHQLGLAVLCDGMGGHAAGARASRLAAKVFRQALIAGRPLINSYVERDSPQPVTKAELCELLREAAGAASRAVFADAARHPQCTGMGTTLVAVLMLDNHAFIVNAGDSRAYLLRNGVVEQLTRDHTVYDELIRSGHLPPGAHPRSGLRNILTRAVGTAETCEVDSLVIDVATGDRILLCSDGVHQYFEAPEGSLDELQNRLLEADGKNVADALIDVANARGGCDDMTAVVLTVGALGDYEPEELAALTARYDSLACSPLFAALNERERATLLGLAQVQSFQPGDTVIAQGAVGGDVFVLLRGGVDVHEPAAGRFELHRGEPLTVTPWPNADCRSVSAVATQPTELLVLPRQALFALLRSDPALAEKVLGRGCG